MIASTIAILCRNFFHVTLDDFVGSLRNVLDSFFRLSELSFFHHLLLYYSHHTAKVKKRQPHRRETFTFNLNDLDFIFMMRKKATPWHFEMILNHLYTLPKFSFQIFTKKFPLDFENLNFSLIGLIFLRNFYVMQQIIFFLIIPNKPISFYHKCNWCAHMVGDVGSQGSTL